MNSGSVTLILAVYTPARHLFSYTCGERERARPKEKDEKLLHNKYLQISASTSQINLINIRTVSKKAEREWDPV